MPGKPPRKNCVSVERVLPLFRLEVDRVGINTLARQLGVSPKSVGNVLYGRQKTMNFSLLDNFLTNTEHWQLSYLSEEEGGFQDVYDSMTEPVVTPRKHYPDRRIPCPFCKGEMNRKSVMCITCSKGQRKRHAKKCDSCGKQLVGGRKKNQRRCWDCYMAQTRGGANDSAKVWNEKGKVAVLKRRMPHTQNDA